MSRKIFPALVLIVVSGAGFVQAEPLKARHSISLVDASGDVQEQSGHPGKDVVNLDITSDGKSIRLTLKFQKEIAFYLDGHLAGEVLSVNFDTDNDETTGGKTFWGDKKGFEYRVGLRTCIMYKNGGKVCVGGLKKPSAGYFAAIQTEKYTKQGKPDTKNIHEIFWKSPQQDVKGNQAMFTIPYSEIGAATGQTVRMAIREVDSYFNEKSFFPDILFTLK